MYAIQGDQEELRKVTDEDSLGRILAEYTVGRRGRDTVARTMYTYIEDDVSHTTTFTGDKITRQQWYVYSGDRLSRMIETDGHDTLAITDYTYFPTGKVNRTIVQIKYDTKSSIVIVTNYNRQGDIESVHKQIYEDTARLVLGRYEMNKYILQYDSSGNKTKAVGLFLFGYFEMADTTQNTTYTYSSDGLLLAERNSHRIDASVPDSIFYFYNDKGLLSRRISFTTSAHHREQVTIADTTDLTYDERGRLIREYSSYYKRGSRYVYTNK